MPTVKAPYEAVFVFSVTLGEEGIAAIKEKFQDLIAQNAELGEVDEWGKRRLRRYRAPNLRCWARCYHPTAC